MDKQTATAAHWLENLEVFLICLLISTLVLVGHTLAFSHAHADNTLDNEPHSQNLGAGELQLVSESNHQTSTALLKHTDFDVTVTGMIASVIVRQTFVNDSTEWVSGRYTFPLPSDSAVHYMQMQIGERTIIGKIREKQQARAEFIAAKKAGKKVSLVEQHRPNLFSNRVANIAPGETIAVELHYLDIARYDQGRFSLRFPTTITPRYIPGRILRPNNSQTTNDTKQEIVTTRLNWGRGWALPTNQVPDAPNITPSMKPSSDASPLTLRVTLDAGLPLDRFTSLHHPASTQQHAQGYQLVLDRSAKLDRDVVVEWEPSTGLAPRGAAFVENTQNGSYAMVMVLPPQPHSGAPSLPKETIFVIDTSGSMAGNSIRQAKRALIDGLQKLKPSDRFNIIEFNSSATPLWPRARQVTAENVIQGERFVQHLQANGGTEMASALSLAFEKEMPEDQGSSLRQVIFITDGSVGNETALFQQIERQRGHSRLFTVGIGSAPNGYFMKQAAEAGRGFYTFIGAQTDIQREMSDVFYKLEKPVLTDLTLSFDSETDNTQIELFPSPIPDLYAGEPVVATFRSNHALPQHITLMGNQTTPFSTNLSLENSEKNSGLRQLWARKKLDSLYQLERDAKFSQQTDKLENIKRDITQVALDHQLMSRYTSFLAIEDKVSRPPESPLKTVQEKNALPAGNSMAINGTMQIPQGALGLPFLWFIAGGCFLLAIFSSALFRVAQRSTAEYGSYPS
ncbi:marine proteobacterial sortase target protein [Aurantivibrio plasticivorans]